MYEALDEGLLGADGYPTLVALKFMTVKGQFIREVDARSFDFDSTCVIDVLRSHPDISSCTCREEREAKLASLQEVIELQMSRTTEDGKNTARLSKEAAEKLYLVVMPLAERNLFVATKQDRRDTASTKHVLHTLLTSLDHMHGKGVLHGDVKPLNIMRNHGDWMLIDLDATGRIGVDSVGFKSSSAYIPPEAVFVNADKTVAVVKSDTAHSQYGEECQVLIAHPSFDVWSAGCILYQLASKDSIPLWQCGQDDNISDDIADTDSLYALSEFSNEVKAKKLDLIEDPLLRNLVSQMLTKDPSKRPSISRILSHPFLSGKKVTRLLGQKPKYEVFISYRVSEDEELALALYTKLTEMGINVYLDKFCLIDGVPWEDGFIEALISTRIFVPLLSRKAINHPHIAHQNFSQLTTESECDKVLLEHALACELVEMGFLDRIYPVFVGDATPLSADTSDPLAATFLNYFECGASPSCSSVCVESIDKKLHEHFENQGN